MLVVIVMHSPLALTVIPVAHVWQKLGVMQIVQLVMLQLTTTVD